MRQRLVRFSFNLATHRRRVAPTGLWEVLWRLDNEGIPLGGGAGAGLGVLSWLVIGTVGVATGGTGVAIGFLAQVGIGAIVGAVGGTVAEVAGK